MDTARTLLLHMHISSIFWDDALLTAGYLINRMPSSVLKFQIPYSVMYPNTPLYSLPLRIFGCVCFVLKLSPGANKFNARSNKCIFLGYGSTQNGYWCYSPSLTEYFTCADVTFFESIPFYLSSTTGFDYFSSEIVYSTPPILSTYTLRLDSPLMPFFPTHKSLMLSTSEP